MRLNPANPAPIQEPPTGRIARTTDRKTHSSNDAHKTASQHSHLLWDAATAFVRLPPGVGQLSDAAVLEAAGDAHGPVYPVGGAVALP